MKKRILSVMVALCLCLSVLPAAASDGDEGTGESTGTVQHEHYICGGDTCTNVGHNCSDKVNFTAWTDDLAASQNGEGKTAATSLPKTTGNYYLENDVTLSSRWTIANGCDIKLCLNGKTLTADNKNVGDTITIEGKLTITDCKGTGKITGTNTSNSGNHKVLVVSTLHDDCTLNMYGGTITGVCSGDLEGGGVRNEGTFNMYGGTITGNSAKNGGGVDNCYNRYNSAYKGPGQFNFYGGTISGNSATNNGDDIYNQTDSTLNANSGTIAGKVYNSGTITKTEGYAGTTFKGAVTNNRYGIINGGNFSGTVTNNSGGTIEGGTFSGAVTNNGTIKDGTFNGTVTNEKTIEGGTFNGTVTNNGVIKLATNDELQAIKDKLTGTGYVTVGTGTGMKQYFNNGTEMNGSYTTPSWSNITGNSVAGCTWNNDTNTLTLSNVRIGTLSLGIGNAEDITIVVDGNVIINNLEAPSAGTNNYTGIITIQGKTGRTTDTLSSGYIYVGAGGFQLENLKTEMDDFGSDDSKHPVQLTNSDVKIHGDFAMRYQDGTTGTVYGLQLSDSTMTMKDTLDDDNDNCLIAESITIDEKSTLTLENAYIANFGCVADGLNELEDFLPDGYSISEKGEFAGTPYYNSGYTIKDDAANAPATNLKLQRYYTVDFDLAGGTLNNADTLAAQRVARGTKVTAPADDPEKAGTVFDGWYEKNGNAFDFNTAVKKDITLCAKYIVPVNNRGSYSGGTVVKRPGGGVTVTVNSGEVIDYSKSFDDVNENDYFSDAVRWACARNITGGATATAFEPHESCTRAQLVTFLWRAAGMPNAVKPSGMKDVDANAYYKDAVAWAVEKGIVSGYGDGLFGPDDTVTREQAVTILYRYAQVMSMDTTLGGMAVREYNDYETIAGYALAAMQWAVNTGILKGDQNYLLPGDACTRAQIMTMLYRLMGE